MKTVTTHQAKTHLSRLIKQVQAGEEILILNATVPVARLTAVDPDVPRRPRAGTVTSAPVRYDDDAFEPLSEDELKVWGL